MVAVLQILVFILLLLSVVTMGVFIARKKTPQNELLMKISTIIRGWWIIFTVIATASLCGKWGIWLLFLFLSIYGTAEYLKISGLCEMNKVTIRFSYGVGSLAYYLLILRSQTSLAYIFALSFQMLISTVLLLQNKNRDQFTKTIAGGFGIFTLVVALGSVSQIAFLGEHIWHSENSGVAALLILVILTSLNDVFQFVGGKLFGRKKIVPHLSPNKTEAGFIAGIIGTTLLGSLLFHQLLGISWLEAILLGTAIGISGMFGDLFLSAVKRSNEVKDFSDLIPGHGGVLDRIDSVIFTAPVFHFMLCFLFERSL